MSTEIAIELKKLKDEKKKAISPPLSLVEKLEKPIR
jgi:hypothetical protein